MFHPNIFAHPMMFANNNNNNGMMNFATNNNNGLGLFVNNQNNNNNNAAPLLSAMQLAMLQQQHQQQQQFMNMQSARAAAGGALASSFNDRGFGSINNNNNSFFLHHQHQISYSPPAHMIGEARALGGQLQLPHPIIATEQANDEKPHEGFAPNSEKNFEKNNKKRQHSMPSHLGADDTTNAPPRQHQSSPSENGGRKRKGRQAWTDEEHEIFLNAVSKYGRNWQEISRLYLPSRTPSQLASHAQKYFVRGVPLGASSPRAAAASCGGGNGSLSSPLPSTLSLSASSSSSLSTSPFRRSARVDPHSETAVIICETPLSASSSSSSSSPSTASATPMLSASAPYTACTLSLVDVDCGSEDEDGHENAAQSKKKPRIGLDRTEDKICLDVSQNKSAAISSSSSHIRHRAITVVESWKRSGEMGIIEEEPTPRPSKIELQQQLQQLHSLSSSSLVLADNSAHPGSGCFLPPPTTMMKAMMLMKTNNDNNNSNSIKNDSAPPASSQASQASSPSSSASSHKISVADLLN